MSNLRIKQISNAGAFGGSVIAFDGSGNIWQKLSHTQEITLDDLDDDGFIELDHGLGRKYVHVSVFDGDDLQVIPDLVKPLDITTIRVGIKSYVATMNASDTWVILVS